MNFILAITLFYAACTAWLAIMVRRAPYGRQVRGVGFVREGDEMQQAWGDWPAEGQSFHGHLSSVERSRDNV